jgi:hypothetical protein
MELLENLKKWVKDFLSGTSDEGRVEIKAYNDKYTLCRLKGSTGYVGRISPNVYTPTEWFVVENFSKNEVQAFGRMPRKILSIDGRLTKAHQAELKEKFDLVLLPDDNKKKFANAADTYILAISDDAFWGHSFSGPIYCTKLIKEEENAFITVNDAGEKVRINKNKFNTLKVSQEEKEAKFSKLVNNIQAYQKLSGEMFNKKMEIIDSLKKS